MRDSPPSVLLIASDTIGARMAGSGVRYWNLARVIGARQPVTLAAPRSVERDAPDGVSIVAYGAPAATADEQGRRLAQLVAAHDVVVAQHLPYLYVDADVLASRSLVVDLYAPWLLEKLEYSRVDPERGEPHRRDDVAILNRLLSLGDYFLCASERQRDFWLGALAAAGRLDLAHATASPTMRSLIDIVPFGLPGALPVKTGAGPRTTLSGIEHDDIVLIWNGGLWNWLDPLTAIRAVEIAARDEPRLRLVFMGTRSPGAQVAEMGIVDAARHLAADRGMLDRHVFFNDWVPYDERQNWLLDADAALSLHVESLETRYAFRTRILDSIWCGVPMVATEGDVLADMIAANDIGEVVPPADVNAVVDAIRRVIDPERARAIRANIATVATTLTWERVAEPLLAYCRAPWRLGDARGGTPAERYTHDLERLYAETAQYARHLEAVVSEKDRALTNIQAAAARSPLRLRPRPDLGSILRRSKRG
jgi:glycosyltransferase involved in cell wall biosynthesis